MSIKLQVVPNQGRSFTHHCDEESLVIGRSPYSDLVILDREISRKHARLYREGSQWLLEDLNSHNGTLLNGKSVKQPTPCGPGSIIKLSNSTIVIHDAATPNPAYSNDLDSNSGIFKDASELLENETIRGPDLSGDLSLRRYADRLKLINDVHHALASSISCDELMELILDRIFEHMTPEEGTIFLKHENGELYSAATRSLPGLRDGYLFSQNLAREVTQKGMAALVEDARTDLRFADSASIVSSGIRSLVAAPLLDPSGPTMGMIVLVSRARVHQFTQEDMALLVSLASVAALRLKNLALMEESARSLRDTNRLLEQKVAERTAQLENKNRELETLDDIVKATNREVTLADVKQTLLQQGVKLFSQAEKGRLLYWNPHREVFMHAAALGYNNETLEPLRYAYNQLQDHYIHPAEQIETGVFLLQKCAHLACEQGPRLPEIPKSLLAMTLTNDNRMYGLLIFDNFTSENAFSSSDAIKLNRFREHAVTAISKAELLEELRKKNEEILRRQNQLIMQEKMASLGTLAAGIAHEIKNPLNFVNNLSDLAHDLLKDLRKELLSQREVMDTEIFTTMVDIIRDLELNAEVTLEQGNRADRIVEGMMIFSQTGKGTRRVIELNSFVEKYANLAFQGHHAQKGDYKLVMQQDPDPEVGRLEVSAQSLSRVIINLVNNAVEALVSKKKEVGDAFLPTIRVLTRDTPEHVVISIQDNGPGIPEKHIKQIFTPFFTTKPGTANPGLGLPISYDIIVQEHQGELVMETREGEMTQFTIKLPKNKEESEA